MNIFETLAKELNITLTQVEKTVELIDGGDTIPFIARYRKEQHGTMDDQKIREISDRLKYLRNLDERREEVRNLITVSERRRKCVALWRIRAKIFSKIIKLYSLVFIKKYQEFRR